MSQKYITEEFITERALGNLFNAQIIKELEIIKHKTEEIYPRCETKIPLSDFNGSKIEDLLIEEDYNPDIYKLLFCTMQEIFFVPTSDENKNTIVNSVSNVRFLSKGKFGAVFDFDIGDAHRQFVLKTSQQDKHNLNIVHEFFIGLVLNKLRIEHNIPNFVYTYGLFNCAGFNITKTKVGADSIEICYGDNPRMYYMMMEHVTGYVLKNNVANLRTEDILAIICQLVLALRIASKLYRYNHNDLHLGNIIYYYIEEAIIIPYKINDDTTINIKTNYIVKIIDYGHNSIYYKDKYWVYYLGYNIVPLGKNDEYFNNPINDLYSVITQILYELYLKLPYTQKMFDKLSRILSFFPSTNRRNLEKYLAEMATLKFGAPDVDVKLAKDSIDIHYDFILRLQNIYNMDDIIINNIPKYTAVYSCNMMQCSSISELQEYLTIEQFKKKPKKKSNKKKL